MRILDMLAILLYAAIVSPTLHELSHCVAAWAQGARITEFKPWPHTIEDGTWVGGSMNYAGGAVDDRFVGIAPLLNGFVFLALWLVLGFIHWPLWFLAAIEATEIGGWMRSYLDEDGDGRGDGIRYRRAVEERRRG